MNKTCPHCSHEVAQLDYRKFLKEKTGDWMLCKNCQGKFYIVVPENKRVLMFLLNFLVFLPLFVAACAVAVFWFGIGSVLFSEDSRGLDVRVFVFTLIVIIGIFYFVMNFASRAIQWKLAAAQKSPFT